VTSRRPFAHALTASVIALFAAKFGVSALHDPPSDGDLHWQRWLGERILSSGTLPTRLGTETFTAVGSPWLPHEWLFSTLAAAAQRVGLTGAFGLAIAACAVLALVSVARRAAAVGASRFATTICVLLTGIAMLDSFGVRAQVAAWPLLSAFLALLEAEASWLLLAAVTVVWANVHASAVLAPVLAAAWTAGLTLRDRFRGPGAVRASVAAVAVLAAVAINPFGLRVIAYAASLVHSPIKDFITEWQPTRFSDASFTYGALPLLLAAAAWAYGGGRRSPQRLCALAVGLALMMSASRNIPVFALIAAPYAAVAFTRLLGRTAEADAARRARMTAVAALGIAVVAVLTAVLMWRAPKPPDDTGDLIARLAVAPGDHRLLCEDYAWCGAAVGKPRIRVFLDGRADPYPLPVWQAQLRIARVRPGWQQSVSSYGVDAVIAQRRSALGAALAHAAGWTTAAWAGRYALFVRRSEVSETDAPGGRASRSPERAPPGRGRGARA
jgi:hypothetical protein